MIIYNKKDRVSFHFNDELEEDVEYVYKIERFKNNCLECEVIEEEIENTCCFELELEDGKYCIKVYNATTNKFVLAQEFYVYYNILPVFTKVVKDIFCKNKGCHDCDNSSSDKFELFNNFIYLFMNISCIGLNKEIPIIDYLFCKDSKDLEDMLKFSKFYGTKVDFSRNIQKMLISIYLGIYDYAINSLKESVEDTEYLNSIFDIDKLEECIAKNSDLDLRMILQDIKNLKCN